MNKPVFSIILALLLVCSTAHATPLDSTTPSPPAANPDLKVLGGQLLTLDGPITQAGGGIHTSDAAPSLTLNPLDGVLWGTPGTTVGWGFTLLAIPRHTPLTN